MEGWDRLGLSLYLGGKNIYGKATNKDGVLNCGNVTENKINHIIKKPNFIKTWYIKFQTDTIKGLGHVKLDFHENLFVFLHRFHVVEIFKSNHSIIISDMIIKESTLQIRYNMRKNLFQPICNCFGNDS